MKNKQKHNIFIQFYGTGNAWPVLIESEHPFYNKKDIRNLANASFSIFNSNKKSLNNSNWEILIDAGHGIPQQIINKHNKIPGAIILTHSHFDHIAGLDWIVQSSYRIKNQKQYPVYATSPCIEIVKNILPHLEGLINWKEIEYGEKIIIDEAEDLYLTPFPVWHGEKSPGPALILLEHFEKKVIYTGDILCPLIKKNDMSKLRNATVLISDANNRYPYPLSNHWSIVNNDIKENDQNSFIKEWLNKISILDFNLNLNKYIIDFLVENKKLEDLILNVVDFIKQTSPSHVALIHYSGKEDFDNYNKQIMRKKQLLKWIKKTFKKLSLKQKIILPDIDNIYKV